jgi:hypothetical protein
MKSIHKTDKSRYHFLCIYFQHLTFKMLEIGAGGYDSPILVENRYE